MKIEHQHPNSHADKVSRTQAGNAASGAAPLEKQGTHLDRLSGKDAAVLSERARLLAKASAALEETPDVREERVRLLQEQVANGNYEVPVEALAKKLLSRLKDESYK